MVNASPKPYLGRVLVLGGCGFLGSHIVDALLSTCQAEVYVLSRSATKAPGHHPNVQYIDAEINKTSDAGVPDIEPIFIKNKFDVVFHTITPKALSDTNEQFEAVNIEGTKNVILAAQHSGVKALVYTSSIAVIRPSFAKGALNADETWPLILGKVQEDPYSRSKAAAEKAVLEANHPGGLLTCALRPGGMLGIRDTTVTPVIAEMYFHGDPNIQIGDDSATSDYGSVLDAARTHISAATALLKAHSSVDLVPADMRVDGETFMITGQPIHFWTFARTFYTHFGSTSTRKPTILSKSFSLILARIFSFLYGLAGKKSPLTVTDVLYATSTCTATCEKAKARLGYEITEDIGAAVEKACKWYLEEKKKSEGK